MYIYNTIVLTTFLSGMIASFIIYHYSKKNKNQILQSLLFVIVYANILWGTGVLLGWSKSFISLADNPIQYYFSDILLSSSLFIFRFLLLSSFFVLLENIIRQQFLKQIIRSLYIITIVATVMWIVAWFEIPLLNSRGLLENLMIYSDILIIVSALAASIFMFSKSHEIIDTQIMQAIKILCSVFISLFMLAFIKWLISSILDSFHFHFERILIHSLLIGLNTSIAWWSLKHGDSIFGSVNFKLDLDENRFNSLVAKFSISAREREIIPLICMGKSNNEIANQLFISVETVKDHNHNIFQKTNVRNRNQLANLFMSNTRVDE